MHHSSYVPSRGNGNLLFIVALFAIFGIVIMGSNCGKTMSNKNVATEEAKVWAKEMGYTVKGISCSSLDSDQDGYVSCSLNTEKDGMIAIECIAAFTYGSGCRPLKLNVNNINK